MTTYATSKPVFITTPGDPIHVHTYTLGNGLRLFLSINKEEPRIYTEIAVRAGSKHDPADTTGLAHYFEHMMFKGTDRLGSLDWEKEKPLLDKIEQGFEEHRAEKDPARKKELYAEIDRLSFEAAKFAAANEYDKLVSAMGAKGTNAYTWVEQTVYVNDIPTNELERWFQLESERFRRPVLRLFHTELETVFEEYNISQDKDFRKVMKAVQEVLTPTHPYGTQTTLGRGEDLKNPSQTNIYQFFDRYYVPNNMAMVLCGDFLGGVMETSKTALLLGADGVVRAIDELLRVARWDQFLMLLPRTRGAFEAVHDRTRVALADRVAALYGLQDDEIAGVTKLETSVDAAVKLSEIDARVGEILKDWDFA